MRMLVVLGLSLKERSRAEAWPKNVSRVQYLSQNTSSPLTETLLNTFLTASGTI